MTKDLFPLDYDKPFIRYMGGKQYAKKKLFSFVPPNTKEMVSPFIGGGSFELYCAIKGIRVYAHDNFPSLVRHWNIMLESAGDVMRMANQLFPVKQSILKDLIMSEKIHSLDAFPNGFPSPERDILFAALAMCMTRQGFNGYYMKTNYFRDVGDPVLARFKKWDEDYWDNWGNANLSVDVLDWTETLKRYRHMFLFFDPPYVGLEHYYGQYETKETTYKQPPFDHEKLAHEVAKHENGAIGTYQSDKKGMIKSLYKDFEVIETRWHQGSRKSQGTEDATELIILKEPASRPSRRAGKDNLNIGDPEKICRLYGGYYHLSNEDKTIEKPQNLCEFLEQLFSVTHPAHPCRISVESILRQVNYDRWTCTKDDVRGIIKVMLERGIIIVDSNNRHKEVRLGYPVYEITDMNAHIKDMAKDGIPVKALPHFSYDYDETA